MVEIRGRLWTISLVNECLKRKGGMIPFRQLDTCECLKVLDALSGNLNC